MAIRWFCNLPRSVASKPLARDEKYCLWRKAAQMIERHISISQAGLALVGLGWVAASALAADAYRWQDSAGQIHYGDKPPVHATQVTRVETHECDSDACREEMAQRYREAVAAYERLEEWLRLQQPDPAPVVPPAGNIVYLPAYPLLHPQLVLTPRELRCAGGLGCRQHGVPTGSRSPRRGGRPPRAHRHPPRSFGFPAAQ